MLEALRPTMFVTLQTDVGQQPAAVREYSARVQVEWSADQGPDVDLDELSQLAKVAAEVLVPELGSIHPTTLVVPVGHGGFVLAELDSPGCWHDLAAKGQDLGLVGESLRGEASDLSPLRTTVDLVYGRALIVNSMEIDPGWRGARYGLLAIELGMRELGRFADVAALYPMRPGLTDLEERAAANRGLAQYWAHLGFVDYNGIMILDLAAAGIRDDRGAG